MQSSGSANRFECYSRNFVTFSHQIPPRLLLNYQSWRVRRFCTKFTARTVGYRRKYNKANLSFQCFQINVFKTRARFCEIKIFFQWALRTKVSKIEKCCQELFCWELDAPKNWSCSILLYLQPFEQCALCSEGRCKNLNFRLEIHFGFSCNIQLRDYWDFYCTK